MARVYFKSDVWEDVKEACGNRCVHPDCKCPVGTPLEHGHIVPFREPFNGPDTVANIQPLCRAHNASETERETTKDWWPSGGRELYLKLQAARLGFDCALTPFSGDELAHTSDAIQGTDSPVLARWRRINKALLRATTRTHTHESTGWVQELLILAGKTSVPPRMLTDPKILDALRELAYKYGSREIFLGIGREFLKLEQWDKSTHGNTVWLQLTTVPEFYESLYKDSLARAEVNRQREKQAEESRLQEEELQRQKEAKQRTERIFSVTKISADFPFTEADKVYIELLRNGEFPDDAEARSDELLGRVETLAREVWRIEEKRKADAKWLAGWQQEEAEALYKRTEPIRKKATAILDSLQDRINDDEFYDLQRQLAEAGGTVREISHFTKLLQNLHRSVENGSYEEPPSDPDLFAAQFLAKEPVAPVGSIEGKQDDDDESL